MGPPRNRRSAQPGRDLHYDVWRECLVRKGRLAREGKWTVEVFVNRSIRRLAIWLGAALGALLLVLLAMVMIAPGDPPPPPASSLAHFQSLDFSDLPNLSTVTARDG